MHRLINERVETVLLKKRDIGTSSTAASTSLLQYEIDTELSDLIPRVGESDAVRAYRLDSEAIDQIEKMALLRDDDSLFLGAEFEVAYSWAGTFGETNGNRVDG